MYIFTYLHILALERDCLLRKGTKAFCDVTSLFLKTRAEEELKERMRRGGQHEITPPASSSPDRFQPRSNVRALSTLVWIS